VIIDNDNNSARGERGIPRPLRYVLSLKGKGQSNCADKRGKKERFVVVNKTAPSKNAP
jgi:hypothetical protein